jgi:serine/threonine-protein kinase RsbW
MRVWSVVDVVLDHVGQLGQTRASVRKLLPRLGTRRGHDDAVNLVLSELVTNAFAYGEAPVALRVALDDEATIVSVTDAGGAMPARREPSLEGAGGFGLHLVEQVARDWGVRRREGGGKEVWATVPRTASLR